MGWVIWYHWGMKSKKNWAYVARKKGVSVVLACRNTKPGFIVTFN